MAKLNYDRDVKPLVKAVKASCGEEIKIRNLVDKWQLHIGETQVYEGTLREVYCYLLGMQYALD